MGKEGEKFMGLGEALREAQRKRKESLCPKCKTHSAVLYPILHTMQNITVYDFPFFKCKNCGEIHGLLSVGIAIERLQQKYNLHGGYTIEDLLQIEQQYNN